MITSFLLYDKENNIEPFEWTSEDGEFPEEKFEQCLELYEQMVLDGYEVHRFTAPSSKDIIETRVGIIGQDNKFSGFRIEKKSK